MLKDLLPSFADVEGRGDDGGDGAGDRAGGEAVDEGGGVVAVMIS